MKFIKLIILFLLPLGMYAQQGRITGKIASEGKAISNANLWLAGTSRGTTSDSKGNFNIEGVEPGSYILQATALGFREFSKEIEVLQNTSFELKIELEPGNENLEEIIIVDRQTGLNRRTPYTISHIDMQGINFKGDPNGLMGRLREVPGVYGAEFGQGIVKPFIRGLGFSRVVTIYQGNKLENHQWGADHGLGINDLGIKSVDVIKGPASVLYGSGALGGVLLAKDEDAYTTSEKITGSLGSTYNSVSRGIRTYASAGKSWENDLFFNADLALENHADYQDGNKRIIGNSRFNTKTLRLQSGIKKENFQNKLGFSFNDQQLGIISDEEMLPGQSLATGRNDREMQLPFQKVRDYLFTYNQEMQHEGFESFLHLSHHHNNRKEIESDENLIDLGLKQDHSFYNARLSFQQNTLKHDFGIQGSYIRTRNMENSLDILIPDANIFESGLYYLASAQLDSWFLQGALRYDFRTVKALADASHFVDYGFLLPGEPENRRLERNFSGFTGSLGASRKISESQQFKLNLSSGFRAPDLAELFSNGPHPGTSRFEKGNAEFKREQSFQLDAGYSMHFKDFSAEISAFGSRVDNYIFFAKSDQAPPEGHNELWTYDQTRAGLYGFEFQLSKNWLAEQRLKTQISGAVVRARDLEKAEPLSFVPPDNFNFELRYFALADKSLEFSTRLRLVSDQNRPGFNEEATNGYELLNLGISKTFYTGSNLLKAGIQVQNALNKTYVDHMSILRAFEVSSPGRNLMLNLRYEF